MRRALILFSALLIVGGCARSVGTPSTTPVASVATSPREPSPVPTDTSTASPTTEPVHRVALREGDDVPYLLARRGAGFIAMGDHHFWVSGDGLAWDAGETSGLNGGVSRLVERGDGSLLAFGYASDPDEFRAWTSRDGRSWQMTDVGLPPEFVFIDIARGERGYALVLRALLDGASPEQIWFSSDAIEWELVYGTTDDESLAAVGAGPEGFVAVGQHAFRTVSPPQAFVLASADGRQWITAPDSAVLTAGRGFWSVVPLHGDWVTSAYSLGTKLPILWSPNGLDWEERTSFPIEPVDVGVIAYLASNGSRLFAALADGGGRPVQSNLLTSLDGISWTQTEIPFLARIGWRNTASAGGVDVFLVDGTVYLYRD